MVERNEGQIERPPHWGGFRVWAERVELWVAGPGRVHDRAVWERDVTPFAGEMRCGPWQATRLQP
jgi:pyridoxamine 5'-phosphate oxidase